MNNRFDVLKNLKDDDLVEPDRIWTSHGEDTYSIQVKAECPSYEIEKFSKEGLDSYSFDIHLLKEDIIIKVEKQPVKEVSKLAHELSILAFTGAPLFTSDSSIAKVFKDWIIEEEPGSAKNSSGNDTTPDQYDANNNLFTEFKTSKNPENLWKHCKEIQRVVLTRKQMRGRESIKFDYVVYGFSPSSAVITGKRAVRPKMSKMRKACSYAILGMSIIEELINEHSVMIEKRDKDYELRVINQMVECIRIAEENPVKCREEDKKYLIDERVMEFYAKHPEMDIQEIHYLYGEAQEEFVRNCKKMSEREILDEFENKQKKFRKDYKCTDGSIAQKKTDYGAAIHIPIFKGSRKIALMNDSGDMKLGERQSEHIIAHIFEQSMGTANFDHKITEEEFKEMETTGKNGVMRDFESGKLVGESLSATGASKKKQKRILKMMNGKDIEIPDELLMLPSDDKSQEKMTREATRKRGAQFKFDAIIPENQRIMLHLRGVQSKEAKDEEYMKENKENSKIPFDYDSTILSDISKSVSGDLKREFFSPKDIEDDDNMIENKRFRKVLDDYDETQREMMGDSGRMKWDSQNREKLSKRFELSAKFHMREYDKLNASNILHCFSRMVSEVTSGLTQYSQRDEFLMKRMNSIGAYLLMKPNKIDGHISFSVLIRNEQILTTKTKMFEQWIPYNEEWSFCNFCSINKHRLSHYLNMNELMCCVLMHLKQIFKGRPADDPTIQEHWMAQFFLALESKTPTVVVTLLSRYMYMESIKTGMTIRRTWKILSKFPEFYRSPFSLWCCKNIIEAAKMMALKNPSLKVEDSEKEEINADAIKSIGSKINGLISWVNLREIDDVEQMLYLSYMGVFRNKDEGDMKQGNFVIFGKIMSEELKLYDNIDNYKLMGEFSSRQNVPHSFRVDTVTSCGMAAARFLKRKHGVTYLSTMKQEILKFLKRQKWEDYSTFSASANLPEHDEHLRHMYADKKKGKTMNKRSKVLNNVLGLLTMKEPKVDNCTFKNILDAAKCCDYEFIQNEDHLSKETYDEMIKDNEEFKTDAAELDRLMKNIFLKKQPFECMSELFAIVQERGYIMANVFKKAQHTGPREIFVLDIVSRIVINFMETCSRAVCNMMPTEMLTKGEKKMKRIEDFFSEVNIERKKHKMNLVVTESDSDDKATWCQQFMMKVFCCLKTAIYREGLDDAFYHNLIRVESLILNLVTLKKLELPLEMLNDFFTKPEEKYESFTESMRILKNEFLKNTHTPMLVEKGKIFLRNLSNMMQGILHYTSSLLHTSFSEYSMEVEKFIIESELRTLKGNENFELIRLLGLFWAVSSDDSLTIRMFGCKKDSFEHEGIKESTIKWTEVLASVMSFFNVKLSRWACMVHSEEKSTGPSFSGIMEFNSVWKVFSTTLIPTIKYIYAGLKLKITQEMIDRQRMMTEAQKQLLENGGKIVECELMNLMQISSHYQMLGLDSNKWFDHYWPLCKKLKSPALGYFIPTLPMTCGLSPFDMNYFLLVKENKDAARTLEYLFEKADHDYNENGTPTVGVSLSIGGSSNYRTQLSKMMPPKHFEAVVENDKTFLFREPENVMESLCMIYKKLESSGAVNAFSFNSAYKMHIAGIYLLQSASVTVRLRTMDGWAKFWTSLIGLCLNITKQIYGHFNGWLYKDLSHLRASSLTNTTISFSTLLNKVFPTSGSFLRMRLATESVYDYEFVEIPNKLRQTKTGISLISMNESAIVPLGECLKHHWFPGQFPRFNTNQEIYSSLNLYTRLYPWCKGKIKDLNMKDMSMPFTGWMNMRDFIRGTVVKPKQIFAMSAARGKDDESLWSSIMRLTQSNDYIMVKDARSRQLISIKTTIAKTIKLKEEIGSSLKDKLIEAKKLLDRYCLTHDSLGDNHLDNFKNLLTPLNIGTVFSYSESEVKSLSSDLSCVFMINNMSMGGVGQEGVKTIINAFEGAHKLGVKYRFVKEQHKNDKGIYKGDGEIILVFDDKPIRLLVRNERILKMEVREMSHLLSNASLLTKILRDRLNLTAAVKDESLNYYDIEKGTITQLSKDSSKQCSVFINENLTSAKFNSRIRVNAVFSKGVEIQAQFRGKWITLYSSRLRSNIPYADERFSCIYLKEDKLRQNIFHNLSLGLDQFKGLFSYVTGREEKDVNFVVNDKHNVSKIIENFRNLSESLKESLRNQNEIEMRELRNFLHKDFLAKKRKKSQQKIDKTRDEEKELNKGRKKRDYVCVQKRKKSLDLGVLFST